MKNQFTPYPLNPAGLCRVTGGAVRWPRLLLLALLLLPGLPAAPARAQSFAWATQTSNTAQRTAVATDEYNGTIVLTGFTGTTTAGGQTFTSKGDRDLLLMRYTESGDLSWARQIGSTGKDFVGDVVYNLETGLVYVTGSFRSTVTLGNISSQPNAQHTSAGGADVFVATYLPGNGGLFRSWRAGGTGDDFAYGLALDYDGLYYANDFYLTGSFTGTTKFQSANGTLSLTSSGGSDIFLVKYILSSGTAQMARKLGGTGYDLGTAVTVHPGTRDVYLTGGISPSTHPNLPNAFVARYNAAGTLQWNNTSGTAATGDQGNDIFATPSGVFATGLFQENITFGNTTLTSSGSADAFLVCYPGNGGSTPAWVRQYGGTGWDEGQSLDTYGLSESDHVLWDMHLAGTFTGTVAFGGTTLNAKGGAADRDLFITRLHSDGKPVWARRIGSPAVDMGRGGLSVTYNNEVYFTGHYAGAVTAGPSTLSGPGNLLTRISAPMVTGFKLIKASSDTEAFTLTSPAEINYLTLGTQGINLRANVAAGGAGSVVFVLDGATRTDNTAPFTWAGDGPKDGGGTDYLSFTPAAGPHTLVVVPYAGANGTGIKGESRELKFTVVNKPVVTSLVLINAANDAELGPLADQQKVNYAQIGTSQISVRATTNPAAVGSVRFELDGVARNENSAPYALAGDVAKAGGGTDYKPVALTAGAHQLVVTAYTQANATGTPSNPISITFYVAPDGGRIVAQEPEAEVSSPLRVAPNPFSLRTMLSFTAAESGPATVAVYNAQGAPVARLYEGTVEKGKSYAWPFDGSTQPAGLYFARLKLGQQVRHQRLVLSK